MKIFQHLYLKSDSYFFFYLILLCDSPTLITWHQLDSDLLSNCYFIFWSPRFLEPPNLNSISQIPSFISVSNQNLTTTITWSFISKSPVLGAPNLNSISPIPSLSISVSNHNMTTTITFKRNQKNQKVKLKHIFFQPFSGW